MAALRVLVAVLLAVALATAAAGASADPPVPPGRDPGGVAIAIIGPGLDYRAPRIAEHLARDGEGEIVGFDLVDNDRRPFPASGATSTIATTFADALLDLGAGLSLAPFRVSDDNQKELARAIGMVAGTRARIAVLLSASLREPDWTLLTEASARFPELLFVLPVLTAEMPRGARIPPELPNVVVTAALRTEDVTSGVSNPDARPADLGIVAENGVLAAAAAIAHATAIVSEDAAVSGKDLAAKLIAGATPWPAAGSGPRHGWLRGPTLSVPQGK